uniref:Ketoreductase domain-containing protein n=1 Tax=Alexandrium catenella TaxID=2925 RepID=A0A7S1RAU4_ALECA
MPIFQGREVPPLPRATSEGAVLVTGGVGGIGLVAAEALAEAGARCLVLSSRSGEFPKGLGIEDRLEAMRRRGVAVAVEKCDTGKEKDVLALLERAREHHGSVTAVIHTSGLMAEKALADMEPGGMKRVFDPKAEGASYLHRHTLDDSISAFMMFSSTSALRGSRGQANYAAANAYLDELARLRASQGLPAVSVQWPKVELSGEETGGGLAMSVSLSTVKQVVKQLVCGREQVEPVQVVLPTGYLVPSTPVLASMLEPVMDKAGPFLRGQLEEASRPGKKGR